MLENGSLSQPIKSPRFVTNQNVGAVQHEWPHERSVEAGPLQGTSRLQEVPTWLTLTPREVLPRGMLTSSLRLKGIASRGCARLCCGSCRYE